MAYESSQGIKFTFSGTEFTATQISASKKTPEVDVTSLASAHGSYRSYRLGSIRDGDELKVDFIGLSLPNMTATAAITWTFDGTGSNAGFTAGLPTAALCTSADVTAQVGELIKGSMTLRLSQN
jgi:hypothetical protein